jgi:hypothetical protein
LTGNPYGYNESQRRRLGLFTHQGDTPYDLVYNNGQYSSVPMGMSQHYSGETGITGSPCGPGFALDYNERGEEVCVPLSSAQGQGQPDYVRTSWDPSLGKIPYYNGPGLETNSTWIDDIPRPRRQHRGLGLGRFLKGIFTKNKRCAPGEDCPQFQDGGYTFLQPTSPKLPQGYAGPVTIPSTELATSIGGENGEPAYLVPAFKYGQLLKDPEAEFRKTGEHLGGPFKTWQEAEEFGKLRHQYVEKGQDIPTPIRTWGKEYAKGGPVKWRIVDDTPKAQEGLAVDPKRGYTGNKEIDLLIQKYTETQKKINEGASASDVYVQKLRKIADELIDKGFTLEESGVLPKNVLERDPKTGELPAFCIGTACYLSKEAGDPFFFTSNSMAQDYARDNPNSTRYLEQSEKYITPGDILQFKQGSDEKSFPHHAYVVYDVGEPNKSGERIVTVVGSKGHGPMLKKTFVLGKDNKVYEHKTWGTENDIKGATQYATQLLKRKDTDSGLNELIKQRESLKEQINELDPAYFYPGKDIRYKDYKQTGFELTNYAKQNALTTNKVNWNVPETIDTKESRLAEIVSKYDDPKYKYQYMRSHNISSSEYDALVSNMMGIYGAETKFGTDYVGKPKGPEWPWLSKMLGDSWAKKHSIGPFQVTYNQLPENYRKGITVGDLYDPVRASEATLESLTDGLTKLRKRSQTTPETATEKNPYTQAITPENYLEYLPYLYNAPGWLSGDVATKQKYGDVLRGESDYKKLVDFYREQVLETIPTSLSTPESVNIAPEKAKGGTVWKIIEDAPKAQNGKSVTVTLPSGEQKVMQTDSPEYLYYYTGRQGKPGLTKYDPATDTYMVDSPLSKDLSIAAFPENPEFPQNTQIPAQGIIYQTPESSWRQRQLQNLDKITNFSLRPGKYGYDDSFGPRQMVTGLVTYPAESVLSLMNPKEDYEKHGALGVGFHLLGALPFVPGKNTLKEFAYGIKDLPHNPLITEIPAVASAVGTIGKNKLGINKFLNRNNPLYGESDAVWETLDAISLVQKYGLAASTSLMNKVAHVPGIKQPLRMVARDFATMDSTPTRSWKDVKKYLFGNWKSTYTGTKNITDPNSPVFGRHVIDNYFYGRDIGFVPSKLDVIGLDEYKQLYPNMKHYEMLTKPSKQFGENPPWTDLSLLRFGQREPSVRAAHLEYEKIKSMADRIIARSPKGLFTENDLSKISRIESRLNTIADNPNLSNEAKSALYNETLTNSTKRIKSLVKKRINSLPEKKLSLGQDNAEIYSPFTEGLSIGDNIAGHMEHFYIHPETGELRRRLQDIWKFNPKDYTKKWITYMNDADYMSGITNSNYRRKAIEALGENSTPQLKLDRWFQMNQTRLMDKLGKPFITSYDAAFKQGGQTTWQIID